MQTTDTPKVTRFKVIANRLRFLRAEVWIDGRPACVLANYEEGTIKVSWQTGSLNLSMDAYDQHEGDFCDFLLKALTERGVGCTQR